MEGIEEKRNRMALDVIKLSRNMLLVHLRFLDMALSRLQLVKTELTSFATDGQYLAYEPSFVLQRYKKEKEQPVRDYLHVVLHCVYRHMFIHHLLDQECWDLACDIAVEYTISELGMKAAATSREQAQQIEIGWLKKEVGTLVAEKLYRYFLDHRLPEGEFARLQDLFSVDDHRIWYLPPKEKIQIKVKFRKEIVPLASYSSSGQSPSDTERQDVKDISANDDGKSFLSALSVAEVEADWKNISQRMQEDLKTFSKQHSNTAGNLMQNLAAVNREKYDYAVFLKKFAVLGEVMKISDDEFDYVYYTYGLKLYEKMPLIEPLEYKEEKRIKEFVIAIDTSDSVSGEEVQMFMQKTYNILMQEDSYFSRVNIHIIQCDAEIQEAVVITSHDEFEAYLKSMKILGLGGTDFRPVFQYVDQMIEEKQFRNLRGLLYFTDGYGTFPAQKPPYTTAFVFVRNGYEIPDVPPWAIKLVLQHEDIIED